MWRLTQGDSNMDILTRRSLSRSPTTDQAPDSPSTPVPSSSVRPPSAVVRRSKKCTSALQSESQTSVNLRRSGTYELLGQDIEDDADSVFDRRAE